MPSYRLALLVAVLAALTLTTAPASACPTYVTIDNQSDKSIDILSCGTRKQGSDKWRANLVCVEDLLSNDRIEPGKGWVWKLDTARNQSTEFKVRITYHYGRNGPVQSSESDFAKCSDGHTIVIN